MRTHVALAICILLAAPPLVQADPEPNDGILNACDKSPPGTPCKFVKAPKNVIPDRRIVEGENVTYTGPWLQNGTLDVYGNVTFLDAQVLHTSTSGGVILHDGSVGVIDTSTLTADVGGSPFRIVAEAGSTLVLVDSSIVGGLGAHVMTSAATIEGSQLVGIPRALHLDGVTLTASGNTFANNTLAVYQTGGQPRLVGNTFVDNYECVRDFQTDPDIIGNVFAHCIIGIWHEQSHSTIRDNVMFEDAEPPSSGITIIDGNSPVVENNTISKFVNGIVLVNARAYIRNNTITNNTENGIFLDRNSGPMDIQGNTVRWNGADGIHLENATDVTLRNNVVEQNGGHGVLVRGAISGVALDGDSALDNAGAGFRFESSLGLLATRLTALRNADGVALVDSAGDLRGSNASANRGSGFLIDSGSILVGSNLNCVRAMQNARYGVINYGGLDSATNGWYQGNVVGGVRTDEIDSFVDARMSYWGSPTGPRNVANVGGTGDSAEGQVVFAPFATSPPASCG